MKKLLIFILLFLLPLSCVFSQTNSSIAGNASTSDGKGYLFNFNGDNVDNCMSADSQQYYVLGFAPMLISNGSLIINVPVQSFYNSNTDILNFNDFPLVLNKPFTYLCRISSYKETTP